LGRIGFEGRFDYAAIGRVSNLSARLCAEASDRQILVSRAVGDAVGPIAVGQPLAPIVLKGFSDPVPVYVIDRLRE
jgi:adenylate cyclase